ncbi:hypothetical protein N7517_001840 [Penicillium concentricum]|uniref:Uncharacterized protein n=1 Tax=Penicillium concentricum TaxID=293559 RepID=A0A9W9SUS5_9EURO|nr:uncharacterized protein N7517_001840 [Penicillium concentricum]KAJ5383929.1 hypothetical protein N7517_001840 [Penicillium concentricum]
MQLYRKDRFGAQQLSSVICDMSSLSLPSLLQPGPLFVALPNVDALDPQPPCSILSASLLSRLKTSLGYLRSDLCADQGLRLTTQLP